MNDLIKVETNSKGEQLVSARELHKFLEVSKPITQWFEYQVERAMLVENEDFITILLESTGGRPSKDYAIKLSAAKEIAMLNGGEKGKQARKYFIEMEKLAKDLIEINTPKLPTNYKEALLALIAIEEEKEQLLLQNENLNTVLDNLLDWVSIIKVSKFNGVNEKYFSWRKLKAKSEELGYSIKKAESPRFGYQNLYHLTVFKACYPELDYNLK